MANIEFGKGGVPVRIVAEVYGKDACWVRAGLITGYLPIGRATRNGRVITSIDQMNSKFGRMLLNLFLNMVITNGLYLKIRIFLKKNHYRIL